MKVHTSRQTKRADKARKLLNVLWLASVQDLKTATAINVIQGVTATSQDVDLLKMYLRRILALSRTKQPEANQHQS